jgi:hypothetical protein
MGRKSVTATYRPIAVGIGRAGSSLRGARRSRDVSEGDMYHHSTVIDIHLTN